MRTFYKVIKNWGEFLMGKVAKVLNGFESALEIHRDQLAAVSQGFLQLNSLPTWNHCPRKGRLLHDLRAGADGVG